MVISSSYAFNGSAAVFLLISAFFSGMGWIHMKDIQIFDKKEQKREENEMGLDVDSKLGE